MKFKEKSYFKSYLYLFILSIVISLSAFACNEGEEIIIEPKPLLMKFVNASDYDLSGFKMGGTIQLQDLAVGQETGFIEMDIYASPYKAKINHKAQDTVGMFPLRCDDGYQSDKITEGKYIVVLTLEEGYRQEYDEQGVSLGLVFERLYLISTISKQ
jgi:hypothetical protein